jgi:colicin import membrane protein
MSEPHEALEVLLAVREAEVDAARDALAAAEQAVAAAESDEEALGRAIEQLEARRVAESAAFDGSMTRSGATVGEVVLFEDRRRALADERRGLERQRTDAAARAAGARLERQQRRQRLAERVAERDALRQHQAAQEAAAERAREGEEQAERDEQAVYVRGRAHRPGPGETADRE